MRDERANQPDVPRKTDEGERAGYRFFTYLMVIGLVFFAIFMGILALVR